MLEQSIIAMGISIAAVCAALLMLASAHLTARESGSGREFFGWLVLQGVNFKVETANDRLINRVMVQAMAGEEPFAEVRVKEAGS